MEILQTKKRTKQNSNGEVAAHIRLAVNKTFKMYVDGKFIRSESGRYFKMTAPDGTVIANICRASRKDFRDAVVSSRKAQEGWNKKTAYNKGQILYRIAEMLESRAAQFITSLMTEGGSAVDAEKEVAASVDALIYYAGWSDKYIQIYSSVNPVESSHFNFSFPEPTGIVGIIGPEQPGLLGMILTIAPAIVGGCSAIYLAAQQHSLTACEFTEVLNSSDVPGGVVNILTGIKSELLKQFATHMDVNAVVYADNDAEELKTIQLNAALNVKRVVNLKTDDWFNEENLSPYQILNTQEIKTTWHPVGL